MPEDTASARIEHIERATLDAVAPLAIDDSLPGWLLPFERTPIGRAKSAVPLRHDQLPTDDIARIADRYRSQGLDPTWRMADTRGLAPLLGTLSDLGYRPRQATLVQTGATASLAAAAGCHTVILKTTPDAAWRSVYTATGFDPTDGEARIAALSRSRVMVYATAMEGDQACAAGTASISRGWIGIHGMRTVPAHRQRGMASAILGSLAQEGMRRGMSQAFLQVEEANTHARTLYAQYGFSTAWTYHYWSA